MPNNQLGFNYENDQEIKTICGELENNPDKYQPPRLGNGNDLSKPQRKLRNVLVALAGYQNRDTNIDIRNLKNSLSYPTLVDLNDNSVQNIYIFDSGNKKDSNGNSFLELSKHKPNNNNNQYAVLSSEDLKQSKESVEVFYDETELTQEDVYNILQLKSLGDKANITVPKDFQGSTADYKKYLKLKSCFYVIRTQTQQHFTLEDSLFLDPPIDTTLYYSTFPDLSSSPWRDEFCSQNADGPDKGQYTFDDENAKKGYKEVIKQIIRLQVSVAKQKGDAIDILIPSAFFQSLTDKDGEAARKLFTKAVIEVASEPASKGCRGIFLHPYDVNKVEEVKNDLDAQKRKLQIPVVLNKGDCADPQKIAQDNHLNLKIAQNVMGAGLHPFGNGAAGTRAIRAREENLVRCIPTLLLIWDPKYNTQLQQTNRYNPIKLDSLKPQKPNSSTATLSGGRKNSPKQSLDLLSGENRKIIIDVLGAKHTKVVDQENELIFKDPQGNLITVTKDRMVATVNATKKEELSEIWEEKFHAMLTAWTKVGCTNFTLNYTANAAEVAKLLPEKAQKEEHARISFAAYEKALLRVKQENPDKKFSVTRMNFQVGDYAPDMHREQLMLNQKLAMGRGSHNASNLKQLDNRNDMPQQQISNNGMSDPVPIEMDQEESQEQYNPELNTDVTQKFS